MCNELSCYRSYPPALNVDLESRRLFLKGVASLPLAYVLADAELAKAALVKANHAFANPT